MDALKAYVEELETVLRKANKEVIRNYVVLNDGLVVTSFKEARSYDSERVSIKYNT